MRGFTLRCNNCGRVLELKGNRFYSKQYDLENKDKLKLSIDFVYYEVDVKYACRNEINEENVLGQRKGCD